MTVAAKVKAPIPIVVANIIYLFFLTQFVQSDCLVVQQLFAVPYTWGMKTRLPVQKHTLNYTIL